MHAHDVRKPFSMMKTLLTSLATAKGHVEIQPLVAIASVEISHALRQVEGMLQDVMEIGTRAEFARESVDPRDLIAAALQQTYRDLSAAEIAFSYDLKHTQTVEVSCAKMDRVFSNILDNANFA